MTIYTARPATVVADPGNYATNVGGAATKAVAVADDSDTTYLNMGGIDRRIGFSHGPVVGGFAFSDTSHVLHRARVRVRAEYRGVQSFPPKLRAAFLRNAGQDPGSTARTLGAALVAEAVGPGDNTLGWIGQTPGGTPFRDGFNSAAEAWAWLRNQLPVFLWIPGQPRAGINLYEVFIDYDIRTRPTASNLAPSGTVSNTNRPTLEIAYTDTTDDDPHGATELRLYTQAVADSAGFTLDNTSSYPPVWAFSGGPLTELRPDVNLENGGAYRVFGRVGKTLSPSFTQWSAWESSDFTLSLLVPTAPTIDSATYVPTRQAVDIALGNTNLRNLLLAADTSFETGSPGTWVDGDDVHWHNVVTEGVGVTDGRYALEVVSDMTAGLTSLWMGPGGFIPVPELTDIAFVADLTSTNGNNQAFLKLWWFDEDFSSLGDDDGATAAMSGTPAEYSVTAQSPAGTAYVYPVFRVLSWGVGHVFVVDSVALIEGTTPTYVPAIDEPHFELQRRLVGGEWETIARIALEPDDLGWIDSQTYRDNLAPRGATVEYRARIAGDIGQVAGAASAWSSTSSSVTIDPDDGAGINWWVKVPGNPAADAPVRILADLPTERVELAGVFRPPGRDKAVVVANGLGGWDGAYRIHAAGAADYATLETLLEVQGPLLVQGPFVDVASEIEKWVRIIDRANVLKGTNGCPRRELDVAYVNVDPAPPVETT